MDQMINTKLIKKLRNERAWSQEQLSSVSGLSLRTVQRIENEGRCSQESKKALASAFEIKAFELDIDQVSVNSIAANERGRKFGFAGAFIGLLGAYTGITMALVSGSINFSDAGLYYGSIGAFCGVCCAVIGTLSNKYRAGTA
ncbi:helix-turn-helix transcriptional regulator [Gilvimarinus agarilyticus]|uniref:helix-turn-helix transcriptional regulator n=1 Tax=Gilvimarinus agarilyticus TaxID=679259 RepID=UPI0005A29FAE|nr:helix-turn-helix transcriptional regulator [Gilvimarinus agarilyticus]